MRTPIFKLLSLMLSLLIIDVAAAQPFTSSKPNIAGIWQAHLPLQRCSCGCSSTSIQELHLENLIIDGIKGSSYSEDESKPMKSKLTITFKSGVFNITEKKEFGQIIKNLDDKEVCLTTYRLRYILKGNDEMLAGTYISKDENTGAICGYGAIEFTPTSLGYFPISATKNKGDVLPISSITHFNRPLPGKETRNVLSVTLRPGHKSPSLKEAATKDKSEGAKKIEKQPQAQATLSPAKPRNKVDKATYANAKTSTGLQLSLPAFSPLNQQYLLEKSFDVVRTIQTSAPAFTIDLYDNGQIDGDTISLYHNGLLIVSKQRLSSQPISFTLQINKSERVHEFVLVAENLGSIPPNTSLLIVTAGNKRHEVFISTTEEKNAKLLVVYTPQ